MSCSMKMTKRKGQQHKNKGTLNLKPFKTHKNGGKQELNIRFKKMQTFRNT